MDDEDVVFENSALHQHLKDVGYSEEDVPAEAHLSHSPGQPLYPTDDDDRPDNSSSQKTAGSKKGFWTRFKYHVNKAVWDEAWDSEITALHQKHADELVEHVLDNPILEDEDATYVDSFASSMQSYHGSDNQTSTGEGIMAQVIMQISVLGISLAYGTFRMFYLKSPDLSSRLYVWGLDIIAVMLTIATLLPGTFKMSAMGRVVSRLKQFTSSSNHMLAEIQLYYQLTRKAVRLIAEMELVARGFTMASPVIPVSRMEQGPGQVTVRQCPQLRRVLFHSARNILLRVKSVTGNLLADFPAHVEIEGISNYLANLPLQDYGPCVTLLGPDKEAELRTATDDYCLTAVKGMMQLCNVHISEFLRVLTMSCLTKTDQHHDNPGYKEHYELVESLQKSLNKQYMPLTKSYTFHKHLTTDRGEEGRRKKSRPLQQTPLAAAYIAVHSLSLHLQAALKRIENVEEELEAACQEEEQLDDKEVQIPLDLHDRMTSDLKIVKVDIDACKECWEEGLTRVENLLPDAKEKGVPAAESPAADDQSEAAASKKQDPISLFEMGDPLIEDQVFEAYTDPCLEETAELDTELLLSDDERAKKKREKQEALRLLTELKSVISVRATEREAREREALRRQNKSAVSSAADAAAVNAAAAADDEAQRVMHDAEEKPHAIFQKLLSPHSGADVDEDHVEEADVGGCLSEASVAAHGPLKREGNSSDNEQREKVDARRSALMETQTDRQQDRSQQVSSSEGKDRSQKGDDSGTDVPNLEHLKQKLESMGGSVNFSFASDVASLAVARSHQMAAMSEDTFGVEGDNSDTDNDVI